MSYPRDGPFVTLEPVESALVDDVPDDDGRVFRAGSQAVARTVEGQAADAGLVAV